VSFLRAARGSKLSAAEGQNLVAFEAGEWIWPVFRALARNTGQIQIRFSRTKHRLHWVRDVTYDEDRSQVRTGNGPRVMASLRNLAIAILRLTGHPSIATALRYHARQPGRPLQTITQC